MSQAPAPEAQTARSRSSRPISDASRAGQPAERREQAIAEARGRAIGPHDIGDRGLHDLCPVIEGLLLDLDGVLIDSRSAIAMGINASLVELGFDARPETELHTYIGPPLHTTFELLLDDESPSLVEACVKAFRARYQALAAAETVVVDGVEETLARFARKFRLVIATSKPTAFAAPLLSDLGLSRYFEAVVGTSLAARTEDKAFTVGRALGILGSGTAAVMVGDRKFDVHAARAHDVPCIGALWGIGSEAELRDAGAAALVRSPEELADLLGC